MRPACSIIVVLLFLAGCKPDEEIMKGTITGRIYTYDQYFTLLSDQSGVQVKLLRNNKLEMETETDALGNYSFEEMPFGKYNIETSRDGFIRSWYATEVPHVGGYSPTFATSYLYEIPTYLLTLDSIGFYRAEYAFILYLKFNGDTLLPDNIYGYSFRVFAGNSPDVTCDNYVAAGKAYLRNRDMVNYQQMKPVYGVMYSYEFTNGVDPVTGDPLYLRVYPLAMGQGYGVHEYFPEALGRPSNVISFNWDEVVGVQ